MPPPPYSVAIATNNPPSTSTVNSSDSTNSINSSGYGSGATLLTPSPSCTNSSISSVPLLPTENTSDNCGSVRLNGNSGASWTSDAQIRCLNNYATYLAAIDAFLSPHRNNSSNNNGGSSESNCAPISLINSGVDNINTSGAATAPCSSNSITGVR